MNLWSLFFLVSCALATFRQVERPELDYTAVASSFDFDLHNIQDPTQYSPAEQQFIRDLMGYTGCDFIHSFKFWCNTLQDQFDVMDETTDVIAKVISTTFTGDHDVELIFRSLCCSGITAAGLYRFANPTRKMFDRLFDDLIAVGASQRAFLLLIEMCDFQLQLSQLYYLMNMDPPYNDELMGLLADPVIVPRDGILGFVQFAPSAFICAFFAVCDPAYQDKILIQVLSEMREPDFVKDLVEIAGDLSPLAFVQAINVGYHESVIRWLRAHLGTHYRVQTLIDHANDFYSREFLEEMAQGSSDCTDLFFFTE